MALCKVLIAMTMVLTANAMTLKREENSTFLSPDWTMSCKTKLQCATKCLQLSGCEAISFSRLPTQQEHFECKLSSNKEATTQDDNYVTFKSTAAAAAPPPCSGTPHYVTMGVSLPQTNAQEHTIPGAYCAAATSLAVSPSHIYHVCAGKKKITLSYLSTTGYFTDHDVIDAPQDAVYVKILNKVLFTNPTKGEIYSADATSTALYKNTASDGANTPFGIALINNLLAVSDPNQDKVIFLDPVTKALQKTLNVDTPTYLCACGSSGNFYVISNSGEPRKYDCNLNYLGSKTSTTNCACDDSDSLISGQNSAISNEPYSFMHNIGSNGWDLENGYIKQVKLVNQVLYAIVDNGYVYSYEL